jgi:hypothetical protein
LLVQLAIFNAFDVFVCGIQYSNVKFVNVNVFPLYVALVTDSLLATQSVPLTLYQILHVSASLAFDNVTVVPSLHNVNVAVNVLVQLAIFNALDVFVCDVQYSNVKLVNVNVLPLCVSLVTVLVFETHVLVQLT